VAVSNISDCSDVVSVYDYQNVSDIKLVKTFSAADLGYDGSTPLKTCDETGKIGLMLSPHGTGTSAATGRSLPDRNRPNRRLRHRRGCPDGKADPDGGERWSIG
jgi:hypothetical protein